MGNHPVTSDCIVCNQPVRPFVSLLNWSCTVSGLLLLVLAVVIVADVLSRSALGRPITGVFETSEVTFVLVSFLALAWVQHQGLQMRVNVLSARVKGRPAFAMDAVTNLLALAFFGLAFWGAAFPWLDAWRVWEVRPGLVPLPTVTPIGGTMIGTVASSWHRPDARRLRK
jgi:TRAP-type C4-dicarboxylate transport system permease small subunit